MTEKLFEVKYLNKVIDLVKAETKEDAMGKVMFTNRFNAVEVDKKEVNYCRSFTDHLTDKIGFENKLRYLLENFLFETGWANKGNPNNGKDGYSHQYSYNYSDLRHFVEDMVRWAVEQKKGDLI